MMLFNDLSWSRILHPTLMVMCERMRQGDLNSTDIVVYVLIKAQADYKTGISSPSHSALARLVGVHKSTIKRAVRKLNEQGFLLRNEGVGTKNQYQILELAFLKLPEGQKKLVRWTYCPASEKARSQKLKQYISDGSAPKDTFIHISHFESHIEQLSINISINNHERQGNLDKNISHEELRNIESALTQGLLPANMKKELFRSRPQLSDELGSLMTGLTNEPGG